MQTVAVMGPPGCGKTTYVIDQAAKAGAKYGYERVLITSLTRAAALEVAARKRLDPALSKMQARTMHSAGWESIGRPPMLDSADITEWNDAHGPEWQVEGKGDGVDAGTQAGSTAQAVDLYRHRMARVSDLDRTYTDFMDEWSEFKDSIGKIDYTDMIEQAYQYADHAPKMPAVFFADEAQDLSRLEGKLLRKWSAKTETLVLVGDPDQALYHWRGSDPDAMNSTDHVRELTQSYRVPRRVLEYAKRILTPCCDYKPMREGGQVLRGNYSWKDAEGYLPAIEQWTEAGETTMIIAPCKFALPTAMLNAEGIPYHNPYTTRWNPGGQAKDAMVTFGQAKWRLEDVQSWVKTLSAQKCFVRGGKSAIMEMDGFYDDMTLRLALSRFCKPEEFGWIRDRDMEVFVRSMTRNWQKSAARWLRVHRRLGMPGLLRKPSVIIGTIHSVKGGEADNVIVFPDLSWAAWRQSEKKDWWSGDGATARLMYVAATRAKHRLVIARSWEDREAEFPWVEDALCV